MSIKSYAGLDWGQEQKRGNKESWNFCLSNQVVGGALGEAWGRSKYAEGDELLWLGHIPSKIPMEHPSGQFDEHMWSSGKRNIWNHQQAGKPSHERTLGFPGLRLGVRHHTEQGWANNQSQARSKDAQAVGHTEQLPCCWWEFQGQVGKEGGGQPEGGVSQKQRKESVLRRKEYQLC